MINTLRITKPADHKEYDDLYRIRITHRPQNITFKDGNLSYDYVDGSPSTSWSNVWLAAKLAMWNCNGDEKLLDMHPNKYADYCKEIAYYEYCSTEFHDIIRYIRNFENYSPVRMCHGDLTLYNTICYLDDKIVFIDPGDCHELPCIEMDESKMMQSLDQFGTIFRNLPNVNALPLFNSKKIHWALLATHYLRMLKHIKGPAKKFALQRCTWISEVIFNA